MPAVSVRNLRKTYDDVVAVDDLSLTIATGEVVALLGPNGAGKTTAVEILEGHRTRDAGEVSVLGYDPATGGREYRERIGIVLQDAGIEEQFTVRELVEMYRGLYPRRRNADEVIDLVGLSDKRTARVKTLSGGQQRRVDLALGLVGDPELLFLDEPTTGFDPAARRKAWTLVEDLRALGKTILLTTHYMDEAQHLADRVIVIAGGRLLTEGTPQELAARSTAESVITFEVPGPLDAAALPPLGQVAVEGTLARVRTSDPTRALERLTRWALDRGVELTGLELRRPSLEDVYLELIGGEGT